MAKLPTVTVLTDPLRIGLHVIPETTKCILRSARDFFRPRPPHLRTRYRGHFAVTRSLIEGLEKLGVHATYNPIELSDIADTVVVLSSATALRQAIKLKRDGIIRNILAGPNILVFPSDYGGLIALPEVDVCIVNSVWTHNMYLDICPALAGRCMSWPAGVDVDYWRPTGGSAESKVALIYVKQLNERAGAIKGYVAMLTNRGYQVDIIKYGHYSPIEYLMKLQSAALMVAFTQSESQGLAWAEAWSVNVPTLIWRNEKSYYKGRSFACSTAPYLNSQTGLFFDCLSDFDEALSYWEQHREQFKPRDWVLEWMSDQVCAQRLLDIVENIKNNSLTHASLDMQNEKMP